MHDDDEERPPIKEARQIAGLPPGAWMQNLYWYIEAQPNLHRLEAIRETDLFQDGTCWMANYETILGVLCASKRQADMLHRFRRERALMEWKVPFQVWGPDFVSGLLVSAKDTNSLGAEVKLLHVLRILKHADAFWQYEQALKDEIWRRHRLDSFVSTQAAWNLVDLARIVYPGRAAHDLTLEEFTALRERQAKAWLLNNLPIQSEAHTVWKEWLTP